MNENAQSTRLHPTMIVAPVLALVFLLLGTAGPAYAVPYDATQTFTYRQPDDSTFSVKLLGDEFFAYEQTLDGRSIIRDESTGFYCYARLNAGGTGFESTGIPVVTKQQAQTTGAKSADAAKVASRLSLPHDVVRGRAKIT